MASRKRLQQLQKLQGALAEHMKNQSSSGPSAAAAASPDAPPAASTPAPAEVPQEESAPKTPPTKRARKKKEAYSEMPAPSHPPCNASAPAPVPTPVPEDDAPKDPPAKRARTKKPQESNEAEPKSKAPKGKEPTSKAEPKSKPEPKSKAEPKRKQSTAKHDPPDFEVSWANHSRIMEHFNLTEDEATATLVSLLGPDRGGEEFWNKFRARNHAGFEDEPAPSELTAAPAAGSQPAAPSANPTTEMKTEPKVEPTAPAAPADTAPKLLTRAERELIEDSQIPESDDEHDDATCDYVAFDNAFDDGTDMDDDDDEQDDKDEDEIDVTSSGGRPPHAPSPGVSPPTSTTGSVVDQLETQPLVEPEPVIQPVPCADDPGRTAREVLAAKLKSQPTPARSEKVGYVD